MADRLPRSARVTANASLIARIKELEAQVDLLSMLLVWESGDMDGTQVAELLGMPKSEARAIRDKVVQEVTAALSEQWQKMKGAGRGS